MAVEHASNVSIEVFDEKIRATDRSRHLSIINQESGLE